MSNTSAGNYPLIVKPMPLQAGSRRYMRDSRKAVDEWMDAWLIAKRGERLPQAAYLAHYREWHMAHHPDTPPATPWMVTSSLGTRYAKRIESKRARPAFMDVRLRIRRRRRDAGKRKAKIERDRSLRMSGEPCVCPKDCIACAMGLHQSCLQCDGALGWRERKGKEVGYE